MMGFVAAGCPLKAFDGLGVALLFLMAATKKMPGFSFHRGELKELQKAILGFGIIMKVQQDFCILQAL